MGISHRSRTVTLLRAFFLGYLGLHRLYVGKVGTALIWFLTGGVAGVGWVVDCVLVLLGSFRDKEGGLVARW